MLRKFKVYKISPKEHQVVDSRDTDQIWISEMVFWKHLEFLPLILSNYKKLKRAKIVAFTISSFLSAQYVLVTAAQ